MQFFLNGFKPGDPAVSDAAAVRGGSAPVGPLPTQVDVLIVGGGPTGLTLAAQLAAFPGISTRIVEQKAGPLKIGQADGIACRTMEMFEAFGFSDRVLRESYWVNETCFWKPDELNSDNITRSRVVQDVEDGLSEFPHVILNQARVHDFYLDAMRNGPAPIEPDYSWRLVDLIIDESSVGDASAHPVVARLERTEAPAAGSVETVKARYVVGCDGARSAVRGFLGLSLQGESARQAWGVMDILGVTDFPDIRRKAAIHSAEHGSMLIIPREGGYMVRLYIEIDKLTENQRVADLAMTTERLILAAQHILRPYTLEVREVAWWSIYEIGQRLCQRFDDVPETASVSRFPRAFLAGDVCHTHSPKAGQGMNVSMQDAFNLGWKLALVLNGRASPHLLRTYSRERQAVARELIDFDQTFARMFSARPVGAAPSDSDIVNPTDFQDYFVRQGRFTAGTATTYKASAVIGGQEYQKLAAGYPVGMRFHSAPVTRMSDAKPLHLGHVVRADGRWRLFAFADDSHPSSRTSRLWGLSQYLEHSPNSPLRLYAPPDTDIDSVIETIAIYQQSHHEMDINSVPSLFKPLKGRYGLVDYEKVYCPDANRGDIFEMRRIDRKHGALVIVRPDQYVAHVLPLDAHEEVSNFFRGFMLRTTGTKESDRQPASTGHCGI